MRCFEEKKIILTVGKHSKEDFTQRDYYNGGFALGERDGAQLQIQQGKVGTYSRGHIWGDGKLPKG